MSSQDAAGERRGGLAASVRGSQWEMTRTPSGPRSPISVSVIDVHCLEELARLSPRCRDGRSLME